MECPTRHVALNTLTSPRSPGGAFFDSANVRRLLSLAMGEHDREVCLSTLWRHSIPVGEQCRRQARRRMPDLRKGLHVGSIDVVRVVRGVGNTEAARDEEVTGPCSRRPNQLLEDGDLITRSILDVIELAS